MKKWHFHFHWPPKIIIDAVLKKGHDYDLSVFIIWDKEVGIL